MPPLFDDLNDDNFVLFASRHYDNPQCLSVDEFYCNGSST